MCYFRARCLCGRELRVYDLCSAEKGYSVSYLCTCGEVVALIKDKAVANA